MNRGLALSSTMKNCIRLAGLSGALAICLGAYGSHAMKENTSDELRRVCFDSERNDVFFLNQIIRSYFNWLKRIICFTRLLYLLYHSSQDQI
jgi:hypothetical protein